MYMKKTKKRRSSSCLIPIIIIITLFFFIIYNNSGEQVGECLKIENSHNEKYYFFEKGDEITIRLRDFNKHDAKNKKYAIFINLSNDKVVYTSYIEYSPTYGRNGPTMSRVVRFYIDVTGKYLLEIYSPYGDFEKNPPLFLQVKKNMWKFLY